MFKLLIPILEAIKLGASKELSNEIDTAITKLLSPTVELTKQVIEKVTAFVKTVTLKLEKSSLKKFFVTNDGLWVDDSDFRQFLTDAFSDGDESPAEEVTYHWHKNNVEVTHYDKITSSIGEQTIDLATKEGRIEASKRLNFMRTAIEAQPKGKDGDLITNGYANVIGRFCLKNGRVLAIYCYWRCSGRDQWYCAGSDQVEWYAGRQFLSCNGETK